MRLFRIVQDRIRAADLSGTGSFRYGGRWNSKGTYMLYSSETSSLAYLENIIPFDKGEMPPQLYLTELEVKQESLICTPPDAVYHKDWFKLGLLENQLQGDQWMREKNYLGIRVRSAVNPAEYNCLLNPLYPQYYQLLKIIAITEIRVDERLINMMEGGRN
jgi:RES domain-containing protein